MRPCWAHQGKRRVNARLAFISVRHLPLVAEPTPVELELELVLLELVLEL